MKRKHFADNDSKNRLHGYNFEQIFKYRHFFHQIYLSVSICLIKIIGKKFDNTTFAANFIKWIKIKNITKPIQTGLI